MGGWWDRSFVYTERTTPRSHLTWDFTGLDTGSKIGYAGWGTVLYRLTEQFIQITQSLYPDPQTGIDVLGVHVLLVHGSCTR